MRDWNSRGLDVVEPADDKPEPSDRLSDKRRFRRAIRSRLVQLLSHPSGEARKTAARLVAMSAIDPDEYFPLDAVVLALNDPIPDVSFDVWNSLLRRFPAARAIPELRFNPYEPFADRRAAVLAAWKDFVEANRPAGAPVRPLASAAGH